MTASKLEMAAVVESLVGDCAWGLRERRYAESRGAMTGSSSDTGTWGDWLTSIVGGLWECSCSQQGVPCRCYLGLRIWWERGRSCRTLELVWFVASGLWEGTIRPRDLG